MEYPGGKNQSGVYQWLINQMPPHQTYIEPFLGSGAVMRLKRPAMASIGMDADANVFAQWNGDELPGLTLSCGDALEFLATDPRVQLATTLVYLDPPYPMAVRSCKRAIYQCEFATWSEHQRLLGIITALPCMVMISSYYSEPYATALSSWRSLHFTVCTRGGGKAEEWLWMNYPVPFELHDYRYLGDDYRERHNIKKKQKRWRRMLGEMTPHERYAMLEVLGDLRSAAAPPAVVVKG